TNTVCISSPLFDRDPSNNCSSAVYLMQSQVDVVVVKDDDVGPSALSASIVGHKSIAYAEIQQMRQPDRATAHRDYVRPNDIVTYTVAVVNVSAYTSTNFILTETLPLYTHLYVTDSWTLVGGRTYTQALGNLYPGTGRVLYFVVQVDPVPTGVFYLINTICGFGSEYDRTPEDNCHIEDTPLFSTTQILTEQAFLPLILNQTRTSDPRPHVFFSSSTYHVFEGEPTVLITVTLDRPWPDPITVRYATQDGSATAGQDYTATQGILTFAPTQTLRTFNVGIISDTLREYWETVSLNLSEPSPNARLGYPSVATLYIEDVRCVVPTQTLVSLYGPMDVEYDAPTDRLFIANRDGPFGGSLNIAHITPTAYISQSLYGLLSAQGVALDTAHHRLYVVGWDWLNVLDSTTYSLTAKITLGSGVGAHAVAYNPVNQKIYVTGYQDNSITIVDANTLQIRARLTDSSQQTVYEPSYIAVNTNTGKVYVTNHAHGRPIGWVTVVNGSTDQIANIIYLDPAGELYGIAADNVHNRLYVASINAAVIYAIDANTDTQLGYLHIRRWSDNQPVPIRMIAVNPNPGLGSKIRLWLTSSSTEDNGLDNIISLTGDWPFMEQPFLGVNLPRSPERGLKFDPTTRAVIVASAASNLVTILWDTPQTQQCLWPFIAPSGAQAGAPSGPELGRGLYTVVHDFSAK
ncbi:MAG TPA: Calx-beta domain-containing protein, partial [Anaerolineae bacterium]|nr:Calx-beta domain-containing protein [Anaerolineae bacterium]